MESEFIDGSLEDYDSKTQKARVDLESKYYHNLRVPICRLPVEILSKIFVEAFDSSPLDVYESCTPMSPSDIIGLDTRYFAVVLQVCRLWRQVALDTPTMWSKPNFLYPRAAEAMMAYAKSVPLEVSCVLKYHLKEKQVPILSRALKQPVSSIDLTGESVHLDQLLAVLVNPAPYLRSLTIICEDSSSLTFPATFLGDEAPRLTHFEIFGGLGNVPWGSPAFTHLTRLSITGDITWRDIRSRDFSAIAELLRRAIGLQDVKLRDCLPSQSDSLSPDSQIILPDLKRFTIACQDPKVLTTFLRRIVFPGDAKVSIERTELGDARDVFAEYISFFFSTPTITANLRAIHSLTLYLDYDDPFLLIVSTNFDIDSWDHRTSPSNSSFHCQLLASPTFRTTISMLDALNPALGNLQSLTIDLSTLSRDSMIHHFGRLPHLHTIEIMMECPPDVLKSLVHEGKPDEPLQFPALKILGLYHLYYRPDVQESDAIQTVLPIFTDILQLRSSYGVPLEILKLEGCPDLSEKQVKGLQEASPDTEIQCNVYSDIWDEDQDEEEGRELSDIDDFIETSD